MIQGIVLGFGIGLAAYGCARLLFGAEPTESASALGQSRESVESFEHAVPMVPVEPIGENLSLTEPPVEASRSEPEEEPPVQAPEESVEPELASRSEEEPPPQRQQEVVEPDLASLSAAVPENPVTEPKSWYLIATSKGLLRACKCSSWTAHTVAGPFATKKEAQQAKQERE
jgi:hypothetical protein